MTAGVALSRGASGSQPEMSSREQAEEENDHQLALTLQEIELDEEKEYLERWGPARASLAQRLSWVSRALGAASDQVAKFVPRVNSGALPSAEEWGAGRALLEERVALYGLRERVVKGDGNCQFRALAEQLYGSEALHATVRQLVAQQLRLFGELYREYVPQDYDAYCRDMARDGCWGDHVTLKAAADAYRRPVVVLTSYEGAAFTEIEPRSGGGPVAAVAGRGGGDGTGGAAAAAATAAGVAAQCGAGGNEAEAASGGASSGTTIEGQRPLLLSFWAEVHYNSLHLDEGYGEDGTGGGGGGTSSSRRGGSFRRSLRRRCSDLW